LNNVLFLCGYQLPTRRALNDVLEQRGLIDVLRVGNVLADAEIRVSIAVPFLRNTAVRDKLFRVARDLCPKLQMKFLAEIDPIRALLAHDAFLFPYRAVHSVFIPTSLLEAMSVGIPVVAADHAMYRTLTMSDNAARCVLHKVRDADDLAVQILALKRDYPAAVSRSANAAVAIRKEWIIERSADELLAAIPALSR
jgi:glycosyltransferase involved in cell wall biosynthesis